MNWAANRRRSDEIVAVVVGQLMRWRIQAR